MSHFRGSDISLNNVYDLAYDIAQEFEKIVLIYGIDTMKPVIEKVINVLEILESSIKKIEQLGVELDDLKSNNSHLASEKFVNDHEKAKLRQIYEESEESWLAEVMNLKSELSSVKSENELLKNYLAVKQENDSKSDDTTSKSAIRDEENIMNKLQLTLKQRDKQIQENSCNIKALNARIQELLELNKILHSKNQEAKNDIGRLIIEKNDYKSELVLQKRENMLLNESIDELVKSCLHAQESTENLLGEAHEQTNRECLIEDRDNRLKQEIRLLKKMNRLQSELHCIRSKSQYEETICQLTSDENKMKFSKIHQLFHLFLGVTAISEFCWC